MKVPVFKPSKRYLRNVSLSCMAASVKNSELPTVAAKQIGEFKSDPKCDIYLRGNEPKMISAWQDEMLKMLFENGGLATAVAEGIKACNDAASGGYDDFDAPDLQKIKERGIEAFVVISMIAIDEVAQEVVIKARTVFDCVLDEHGIVFVLRAGRWCFEQGDYLYQLTSLVTHTREHDKRWKWEQAWKSVFPFPDSGTPAVDDGSVLFGVWRYNPDETARVRKLLGASAREIKGSFSSGPTLGHYFSPTKTETLSDGRKISSGDIASYERKGNWLTVYFCPAADRVMPAPEQIWCDGALLLYRFDKNVYTRVEDSYRINEPRKEDPAVAATRKMIEAALARKREKNKT
jgi:hypothetical protein